MVKRGRQAVRLGWECEAHVRRLLERAGWTVVPTAMSEPRGDLVALLDAPLRASRLVPTTGDVRYKLVMMVEVKSRSWGGLPSPERRACAEAALRAWDAGMLYRVACPRPKRDGGVWALHVVRWVGEPPQARQISWAALPVEGEPATAAQEPSHLGGAPERVKEAVDTLPPTESQGGT